MRPDPAGGELAAALRSEKANRPAEALSHYRQALDHSRANPAAFSEVVKHLSASTKKHPKDVALRQLLGAAYLFARDLRNAEIQLRKAAALAPNVVPILILFGGLILVSEALRTTGATDLVAGWLSTGAQHVPPLGALGMMLIAAMALTPFLNNAATVLVMAPIGASLAGQLGLSPDPFLMAVAVGAGCDFLTPIGHQCNTLVMGPGGYRFGDYWRLGLPLSLLVLAVGVAALTLFWPLA